MAIELTGTPELKWHKIGPKDEEGHKTWVLCVCVWVKNTGPNDETPKVTFRGYIQNTQQPPGPNQELTLCEDKAVKVKKNTSELLCCCNTELISAMSGSKGWFVCSSPDADKDAKTPAEKIHIPDKPK